jgi:hypothetical protein
MPPKGSKRKAENASTDEAVEARDESLPSVLKKVKPGKALSVTIEHCKSWWVRNFH